MSIRRGLIDYARRPHSQYHRHGTRHDGRAKAGPYDVTYL